MKFIISDEAMVFTTKITKVTKGWDKYFS